MSSLDDVRRLDEDRVSTETNTDKSNSDNGNAIVCDSNVVFWTRTAREFGEPGICSQGRPLF